MSNDTNSTAASGRIKSFIERLERLHADRAQTDEDIAGVFAEAKGDGFDVKLLKKLLVERRADPAALNEEAALMDLYRKAVA